MRGRLGTWSCVRSVERKGDRSETTVRVRGTCLCMGCHQREVNAVAQAAAAEASDGSEDEGDATRNLKTGE